MSDLVEGNVVASNGRFGIVIGEAGADDNIVAGNFIGTDAGGTLAMGNLNHGVAIAGDAQRNQIGGSTPQAANTIAHNGGAGLLITRSALDTLMSGNHIYANAALGIDLSPAVDENGDWVGDGITPNDPGDADTGPNNLQNFPVLTSATLTTVEGTLNSTPNTTFTLEFFSNTECDPFGAGEGEIFLPTTAPATVTTDSSGDAAFTFTFASAISAAGFVTATATDPNNNTSEFSACLTPPYRPPTMNLRAQAYCPDGRVYFFWDALTYWPDAIEIRDADTDALVQRIDYPETQYAYCRDNDPYIGRSCGGDIAPGDGGHSYYAVILAGTPPTKSPGIHPVS